VVWVFSALWFLAEEAPLSVRLGGEADIRVAWRSYFPLDISIFSAFSKSGNCVVLALHASHC
jgi:hypothetical protein